MDVNERMLCCSPALGGLKAGKARRSWADALVYCVIKG